MPGWIKDEKSGAGRATEVDEKNVLGEQTNHSTDAGPKRAKVQSGATEKNHLQLALELEANKSSSRTPLSEQQRDALMAEMLGDVAKLCDLIEQMQVHLGAINQTLTANDMVRWRNALDLKISELAEINLSEHAAQRLESFAKAYMEQLSKESNTLVRLQVKKAVNDVMAFNQLFDRLHGEWLQRLGHIGLICVCATLLGNFLYDLMF